LVHLGSLDPTISIVDWAIRGDPLQEMVLIVLTLVEFIGIYVYRQHSQVQPATDTLFLSLSHKVK
jgi:hypothetical protein